jgi:acetyltransferase-like isoleucine patch superfamily enzyme
MAEAQFPILGEVLTLISYARSRWRKARDPVAYARSIGARVGNNCRLIDVEFGSEPYLVTLGHHVSATSTRFITHDGGVWVFRDRRPDADVIAPITVGNNVFFGSGVIVLPGVSIGDNVVIGAGAVVTRDIESNCVAAGVPATRIRSLAEYWQAVEPRLLPTKLLDNSEKRAYLLAHLHPDGNHARTDPPEPSLN